MLGRVQQQDIKTAEDTEGGIDMNALEFVKDMPLMAVLSFAQNELPLPAEVMMQSFLNQVHQM